MTEEQYHIIDQYLRNELEGESLAAFEKQLLQDAELAETVELFKLMNNEMPTLLTNKPGGEALKKNLQQISKPHFKNEEAAVVHIKKNNWYKLTAVAAMLIAIAGVAIWQFTKNDKVDLYAQYIDHEKISLISRGNGGQDTIVYANGVRVDTKEDTLAKATEYYNDHHYAAVIPLLQPITEQDTANAKYRIILSRCYIETNAYEKALSSLNTIAAGNSAYQYEAVWLTAMAYLKQDKIVDCINLLETIPAEDDIYIKAQQLLKELK